MDFMEILKNYGFEGLISVYAIFGSMKMFGDLRKRADYSREVIEAIHESKTSDLLLRETLTKIIDIRSDQNEKMISKLDLITKEIIDPVILRIEELEKRSIEKNTLNNDAFLEILKILIEKQGEKIDSRIYNGIIKRNNIKQNIDFIKKDIDNIVWEEMKATEERASKFPFNSIFFRLIFEQIHLVQGRALKRIIGHFESYADKDFDAPEKKESLENLARAIKQEVIKYTNKMIYVSEKILKGEIMCKTLFDVEVE